MSMSSLEDQNRMMQLVAAVVTTFEPRLLNVSVTMEPASPSSRMLHFRIEAMLRTEPTPARVFSIPRWS